MLSNGIYTGTYLLAQLEKMQDLNLKKIHLFLEMIENQNTKQQILWLFNSQCSFISVKRDFICDRYNGFDFLSQVRNPITKSKDICYLTLAGFYGMPQNPRIPINNNRRFDTPDGLKELIIKKDSNDNYFIFLKNIYKAVIEPDIDVYSLDN